MFGWNILAIIFEVRNKNVFVSIDKAKMKVSPTGEAVYLLKAKKIKTRPMKYEDIMITRKGKNVITLVSTSRSEYFPVSSAALIENRTLVPIDEDLKHWYAGQVKEAHTIWVSKMQMLMKWIPAALIGATTIGIVLMLYFMFDGMNDLAGSLGGVTTELSTLAQEIKIAVAISNGADPNIIAPPF